MEGESISIQTYFALESAGKIILDDNIFTLQGILWVAFKGVLCDNQCVG